MQSGDLRPLRWIDALAIIAMLVVVGIASATFRDYGPGWDDYAHYQYGNLLVSLYQSGFTDKRALSFLNLYLYGGGFDLFATLCAKFLPFDPFETRRFVGAAVGLIGLFVTWQLGRRLAGPLAGFIALLLLATCPLYYGHMFMNPKDEPLAVAMAIALLGAVRALQEYPHPKLTSLSLYSVGVGLAIGSRVLGFFAMITLFLPLLFILAVRLRKVGVKSALHEWCSFLMPFIPGVILAYVLMGLVWPWSVVSPLNPIRAVEYFASFHGVPWRELFDGRLMLVYDMPRTYVLRFVVLTLPELMVLLGLCGTVGVVVGVVRLEPDRPEASGGRAALLAVLLSATLPVVITVITRPMMYSGIRHFLFLMPPFAVLGGVAGAWIARYLWSYSRVATTVVGAFLMTGLVSPAIDMMRLHPYEYTYFNRLGGGVAGARSRYMLDYWGLSLYQASIELRSLLPQRGETPPDGKWTVAICGPPPEILVALGPQFLATWNPKGADFAIVPNEFYCAELDAPILYDVVRAGVVYARVYDIRGRSISTLMSLKRHKLRKPRWRM